jgi:hypothetical protein
VAGHDNCVFIHKRFLPVKVITASLNPLPNLEKMGLL